MLSFVDTRILLLLAVTSYLASCQCKFHYLLFFFLWRILFFSRSNCFRIFALGFFWGNLREGQPEDIKLDRAHAEDYSFFFKDSIIIVRLVSFWFHSCLKTKFLCCEWKPEIRRPVFSITLMHARLFKNDKCNFSSDAGWKSYWGVVHIVPSRCDEVYRRLQVSPPGGHSCTRLLDIFEFSFELLSSSFLN